MADLSELERAIEQHNSTWYTAAKALEQISQERLYEPDYPSFRQYYSQRLKIGESRVFQLLRAAKAIDNSQIATDTTEATQAKINDLGLSEVHIRPICINRRSPQLQGQLIDELVQSAREADKLPSANIAKAVIKTAEALQRESTRASSTPKVVTFGDIWQLGKHKLYCCDSADWRPESNAVVAFADPPYGVDVADWDKDFYWEHDYLQNWADYVFVTPGTSNIIKFGRLTTMDYRWNLIVGLPGVYGRHSAIGTSNTIQILLFSALESVHRKASDYFTCSFSSGGIDQQSDHPGRKPIEMIQWLIKAFTNEGDLVIDPFLGSGSTLIAAELEGRICFGCEISPEYCAAIIGRWEAHTGQGALLSGQIDR